MRSTFWLLLAIYAVNYLDRQIVSLLLEPIRVDLNLSDLQAGLLSGPAFAVVYALVTIPAGIWAATGNRRNIIALSALLWGAMTVACGFAVTFWQLLITRAAVAVGEAGSLPGSHSILSDGAKAEGRLKVFGKFMAGPPIGEVLAVLIGGVVGLHWGWRTAMVTAGIIGMVPGLLLFLVPEPERPAVADGAPSRWSAERSALLAVIARIISNPVVLLALTATVVNQITLSGAVSWFPAFIMREHGFSPLQAAALVCSGSLLAIAGTVVASRILSTAALRNPAWLAWGPAIAVAAMKPFVMVFILSDVNAVFIAAFLIPATLTLVNVAPMISLLHEIVTPAQRPVASALLVFLMTVVGLGLGPAIVGWISTMAADGEGSSLRVALIAIQVFGVAAAGLYWMAGNRLAGYAASSTGSSSR